MLFFDILVCSFNRNIPVRSGVNCPSTSANITSVIGQWLLGILLNQRLHIKWMQRLMFALKGSGGGQGPS